MKEFLFHMFPALSNSPCWLTAALVMISWAVFLTAFITIVILIIYGFDKLWKYIRHNTRFGDKIQSIQNKKIRKGQSHRQYLAKLWFKRISATLGITISAAIFIGMFYLLVYNNICPSDYKGVTGNHGTWKLPRDITSDVYFITDGDTLIYSFAGMSHIGMRDE